MTSPANSELAVPAIAAAPVQVAGFCGNCGTPLAANAHFCHRCGTPFGLGGPPPRVLPKPSGTSVAAFLPWGVACIALLALVANFAGKNFGSAKGSSVDGSANSLPTSAIDGGGSRSSAPVATGGAPFVGATDGTAPSAGAPSSGAPGGMPNIAKMSPSERAARLFTRIMQYAEAGKTDSVSFFAPMALASHEMLTAPSEDERYHYGRIAEVTNQPIIAKAQADTLLAARQGNLLGLLLAARAARMIKDTKAERTYDLLLLKVVDRELATKNADYDQHRAEIDRAVAEAKAMR